VSIFDTCYIGTPGNRIVFNDYSSLPIYRVESKRPQARQIRDLDIVIPFESGASDFETLIGKMAYVIEGEMFPASEADYSTGLAALRKLSNLDYEQNDNDSDFGYVPFVYSENGIDNRQIFIKILYVDINENVDDGFVTAFRLICKIKDPTIYGYPSKTASTQGTDVTAGSSSAIFPFTFPIVFGSNTGSVTATAINSGTIPVYPQSLVVVGPVNSPRITNGATGEYIEVSTNLSSSSSILTITYDKDSLSVEVNGNSVLSSVTSASTYFKLQPGANPIALTGSSIGANAYAACNYRDGYALS
jgi:hypothetical protein